uniref:Uncharacterized protein n=1 Tax=Pseudomonas phage HRDY3 TaxID=3236930 RepID=A0AB39CE29_9VIRU
MDAAKENLIACEPDAFALWKVDAPLTYKRQIVKELYALIRTQTNPTNVRLFNELKRTCFNVTRVEFDSALASLVFMDMIGIQPTKWNEGETVHVNRKRRRAPAWRKYLTQLGAIPMAS